MKIFLIPGLGADTKIYNNIDLQDHDVVCVNWIIPHKTDTLSTYAHKLIYQYDILNKSIIIGNSLGGMIAVEIAKLIEVDKCILISSIKTAYEAPAYFKALRVFPFYRAIPGKVFTSAFMESLIKPFFGHMNADDAWLFKDMLRKSNPVFLKWAMKAILKWDNKVIPKNVFQITGDKDSVFNYRKIKNAQIVKGGTHVMIFERAKDVTKWLKKILEK
jgi:pimeloyl-ACP methyl ester carboxylesterase